jgi:hypothetical protein
MDDLQWADAETWSYFYLSRNWQKAERGLRDLDTQ